MKTTYKGCEIEVFRDQCLGGWEMLFFSVFDGNYEVTSGFSESSETVREFIKGLKNSKIAFGDAERMAQLTKLKQLADAV